ncbi:MAG: S1 RNA-binding domain-containing protein [Fuerstiella sp.]
MTSQEPNSGVAESNNVTPSEAGANAGGQPSETVAKPLTDTQPVVSAQQPTASVADMMAGAGVEIPTADSPAGSETPAPPAEPAAVESAPPAASTESPAETSEAPAPKTTDRVKSLMTDKKDSRPVGNVDLATSRPDIPVPDQPIDIPEADASLDDDLEAQISAAMQADTPAAPAPAPAATGDQAEAEVDLTEPGTKLTGIVQAIHGDDVFLAAGLVADVIVPFRQFAEDKQPKVGDSIDVVVDVVDNEGLVRARLPRARTTAKGDWDSLAVGQILDVMVTGTNKGGLQISVSNIKGFLPASQIDLGFVSDMEQYVGQKLTCQVTEVKPKKRNLVVSRRALLQAEREEGMGEFLKNLEVGQDFPGTVKTLKNYGAFVSLGPIDGFLHIGEISWSRINHPNEVLNEGQEIQVRILKIDEEKNRISLGMKQLVQNPWQGLNEKYPSERVVDGKVTRVAEFGAFVELEPGVEGMVHISELAWRRVGSVGEVLSVGDQKEFQVLEVDQKRRRVSLSLKALEQKPESAKRDEPEDDNRPPRTPPADLRGGMGGGKNGGGLFGNPGDFT